MTSQQSHGGHMIGQQPHNVQSHDLRMTWCDCRMTYHRREVEHSFVYFTPQLLITNSILLQLTCRVESINQFNNDSSFKLFRFVKVYLVCSYLLIIPSMPSISSKLSRCEYAVTASRMDSSWSYKTMFSGWTYTPSVISYSLKLIRKLVTNSGIQTSGSG